jgi:hypothetical protein
MLELGHGGYLGRMDKVVSVVSLVIGLGSGVAGAITVNEVMMVTGAILVCTPLIIKLIDELLVGRWSEAIITCSGLTAFIFICDWSLILGISDVFVVINIPTLSLFVMGSGTIQLLWMYLVVQE